MDQWDRELAKAGIQMAGAAAKGMGNVMVAVIDVLIEKGVFSIEEIRDMLDRLEVTVRRAEGEIEGDLPQEAEVAATMAIVDHLRDILISRSRSWTSGLAGALDNPGRDVAHLGRSKQGSPLRGTVPYAKLSGHERHGPGPRSAARFDQDRRRLGWSRYGKQAIAIR